MFVFFREHCATALRKDVLTPLWRYCFYKPIEEFRGQFRKATGNALTSLYEEFSSFLDSSKRFFLDLVKALYMELYQSSPPAEHLSPEVQAEARNALSKMLVFLGDLDRYHQQHQVGSANFKQTSFFYHKAVRLSPSSGSPQNQLAVVATYSGDMLECIYRYFRALMVTRPFTMARENLKILFEKNRVKVVEASNKVRPGHVTSGGGKRGGGGGKKGGSSSSSTSSSSTTTTPPAAKLDMITRFVRLHGMLFTKTGMEDFLTVHDECMRQISGEMKAGTLRPEVFFKMVVMDIFAISNVDNVPEGYTIESSASSVTRSFMLQHSLILLYDTIRKGLQNIFFGKSFEFLSGCWVGLAFLSNNLGRLQDEIRMLEREFKGRRNLSEALSKALESILVEVPDLADSSDGAHFVHQLPDDVELLGITALNDVLSDRVASSVFSLPESGESLGLDSLEEELTTCAEPPSFLSCTSLLQSVSVDHPDSSSLNRTRLYRLYTAACKLARQHEDFGHALTSRSIPWNVVVSAAPNTVSSAVQAEAMDEDVRDELVEDANHGIADSRPLPLLTDEQGDQAPGNSMEEDSAPCEDGAKRSDSEEVILYSPSDEEEDEYGFECPSSNVSANPASSSQRVFSVLSGMAPLEDAFPVGPVPPVPFQKHPGFREGSGVGPVPFSWMQGTGTLETMMAVQEHCVDRNEEDYHREETGVNEAKQRGR